MEMTLAEQRAALALDLVFSILKQNDDLQEENKALRLKVEQLEKEKSPPSGMMTRKRKRDMEEADKKNKKRPATNKSPHKLKPCSRP